jgi:hypothetical protein
MLGRTIKSHGHFRWKQHDLFLSEVLWGERIGLLPEGDRESVLRQWAADNRKDERDHVWVLPSVGSLDSPERQHH